MLIRRQLLPVSPGSCCTLTASHPAERIHGDIPIPFKVKALCPIGQNRIIWPGKVQCRLGNVVYTWAAMYPARIWRGYVTAQRRILDNSNSQRQSLPADGKVESGNCSQQCSFQQLPQEEFLLGCSSRNPRVTSHWLMIDRTWVQCTLSGCTWRKHHLIPWTGIGKDWFPKEKWTISWGRRLDSVEAGCHVPSPPIIWALAASL